MQGMTLYLLVMSEDMSENPAKDVGLAKFLRAQRNKNLLNGVAEFLALFDIMQFAVTQVY